jgi:hypothetical protein
VEPNELELFTTTELIDELMRRKTFLGVIVRSEQELRTGEWRGEKVFKVHVGANLSAGEAGRLLGVVAEHIQSRQP